jgi:hypothetical protein
MIIVSTLTTMAYDRTNHAKAIHAVIGVVARAPNPLQDSSQGRPRQPATGSCVGLLGPSIFGCCPN